MNNIISKFANCFLSFFNHKGLIVILILSLFLLFSNLGQRSLWYDEAETAIVGQNSLLKGYPSPWDEKNFITFNGIDFKIIMGHYIFVFNSWIQYYLAGISIFLLGKSPFAARLPFAIIGFFSLVFFYFLALKLFNDKRKAILATLLLAFSIPFLLHVRQCRYYSLVIFNTIFFLHSYLDILSAKKGASWRFILSSVLLFHSQYLLWFSLFPGIIIHLLICDINKLKKIAFLSSIILLLTIPWFLVFPFSVVSKVTVGGGFSLINMIIFKGLVRFLWQMSRYYFPLILLPFIPFVVITKGEKRWEINKNNLLLVMAISSTIIFLSIVGLGHYRYGLAIFPIFTLLLVEIISWLEKRLKPLVYIVVTLLLLTNIVHDAHLFLFQRLIKNISSYLPAVEARLEEDMTLLRLRCYLLEFFYEITHPYDGPQEGIIKYLKTHAKPQETIMVVGDNPAFLIFATDLKIRFKTGEPYRYSVPLIEVPENYPIDWILVRGKEPYLPPKNYERIVLDYPDVDHGNSGDYLNHQFKSHKKGPRIILYRLLTNSHGGK